MKNLANIQTVETDNRVADIRPEVETAPAVPRTQTEILEDRVVDFMEGFSIEIAPQAAGKIANFGEHLPAGSRVYLPWLPGARLSDALSLSARLRLETMEPVPHIAARRVESKAELDENLAELKERAQVSNILLIAGDIEKPAGPYKDTLELLEDGLLEKHGIKSIAVAGHPETNPFFSDEKALDALKVKNAYARDKGVDMPIVTQFSFSIEGITAWERGLRDADITLPINIGLAGPASMKTLIKFAAMCGVGASMGFVKRNAGVVTKLLRDRAPDDLVTGLAQAVVADPDMLITSPHFYTFGGLVRSVDWIDAVLEGRFKFNKKQTGFDIVQYT